MGVPAGLAFHLIPAHGFVAAHYVFDGTGHHMVYAGVAVGRWRPFEKHKRWSAFARLHCALEQVETVPAVKGGMIDLCEVQVFIFVKLHDE